jgi:peptidoglycan/xylan/chitin deacetylase (PgdA/CDA1 family)
MGTMHRKLAILGYHKVGDPAPGGWSTWFCIPAGLFAEQLQYLRDNEWEVIDVPDFLEGLRTPQTLPLRSALITFDDGYRCVLDVAGPLLRQFGFPAVMFVPTDYIGGTNTFDNGAEPAEPICNWDELLDLERSGISVQSHGMSHRPLSSLEPCDQEREMAVSKQVLEAKLNRRVDLFAYPYGDAGANEDRVAKLLQATGYRAACLYKGLWNSVPPANPYRLSRVPMGPDTDLRSVLG